ncbi:Pimeloyl-[acyl-carrier protein] methyl ester esterase [Pseudidiomarina piscicola]|uniref:Pimeloyl-[acyl-carrier protein] methyl ester esterase n=1 Tax=Pseudidiomarina piscicola TaxID=2614830 RepID=A0A6S6WU84_9GAMM|nr:pimeloyl-ACP methyl ester esterase BioH [Pseudidiomarina piscicola]CAB0150662.1 Pimeloyl-[acyl-carrier protein] methyl ester esterase [Pseudidiomarina piscicola]VZT40166.1 Pimeloyl-[acyl-carrier protein] methyl ester esterase [Pseudomonas aeruginosa]
MVTKVCSDVSGTGADIVVLHGWGLNSMIWTPIKAQLAELGRLTQLDLPGYGESPWPSDSPVTFATLCELTRAALPARCHLVGWSLGGLVATQLALDEPQRIQTLTTVASSPYFPAEPPHWPGIQPSVLNQFGRQLSKDFRRTVERFLALQSMGSPHAKQDVKAIKEWLFSKPMASVEVLDAGLDMLAQVDLRSQLQQLTMPYLRIYGRLDALVPSSVVEPIDRLAPTSEAYVAPHCSHAPFISDPDGFMEVWRAFFQRHA